MPPPDAGNENQACSADTGALFELSYQELRRLAQSLLSPERQPQTLQATALVHEAYLRLSSARDKPWANERHFFVTASEAMRRILIDQARKRRSRKRGGGMRRTELPETALPAPALADGIEEVSAAMDAFAKVDPLKAELVKLRFFGGLQLEEVARLMGISPATAKRHWRFARAWLHEWIDAEMSSGEPPGE